MGNGFKFSAVDTILLIKTLILLRFVDTKANDNLAIDWRNIHTLQFMLITLNL